MHALASEHKKTRVVGKSNALVSSEGQRNSTSQKEKWKIQCIEETICRIVFGGSSGIALAVAEQAASQGAKVVVASSNAE